MTVFDPTEYPELRNLFPELTSTEFEISMLLAFGVPQKQISYLRSVSYRNTQKVVDSATKKFEQGSLTALLTIIYVRLVLFVLRKCHVE